MFAFQNLIKVTDSTGKQQIFLKLQEQAQKNLEQEVHNYREEAQKQQKIIHQLEKDRDRYINETSGLRNKVGGLLVVLILINCLLICLTLFGQELTDLIGSFSWSLLVFSFLIWNG